MIVHGPRMRVALLDHDRRLTGRVDVVPHGTLGEDDESANSAPANPAAFLFFGRIESYKGLGLLLDAAGILKSRGTPVNLVIAGTGTDLPNHRMRIAAMNGAQLIDRHIDASDVPALFRRCAAVVLPYTDATQSGVAAIAVANACPVIASNVGDLPEVVLDGRTGLLVPAGNASALADAMGRLISEPGLRDFLARGAHGFARDKLSWQAIAEKTAETYARAIRASQATDDARVVAMEDAP
jgi:glycosyltransferase involved in cell wall biosynthesis